MYNNLKKEIEKDFNKEKNYNAILSKVEGVSSMKKLKIKYALIPICIIIIAIVGFNARNLFNSKTVQNSKDGQWIIKEVYGDSSSTESATAIVPRWEEMSISQQFSEVNYNNNRYSSRTTKIERDKIGNKIGTAILTGYDTYTKTSYNKNGDIYSVNDLSQKCVIAVQFENDSDYYVYVNPYYKPTTLGEFMEDLNLKNIVSFGTIHYNYCTKNLEGNMEYSKIEFYNVDNNIIWQMLFNDVNLKNIYSDNDTGIHTSESYSIGIGVDIPLLGYKNISVSLTDKGYLITNILDSGKAFYIGESKVQEFLNYIIDNYDGYKIVYVDKNQKETTDENSTKDDTVVMYDITNNTTTYIKIDSTKNNGNPNSTAPYDPTKN